jgi:hypothetical protein
MNSRTPSLIVETGPIRFSGSCHDALGRILLDEADPLGKSEPKVSERHGGVGRHCERGGTVAMPAEA